MKIILPDKSVREYSQGTIAAGDLVRELGFDPIEVLVARNGTLVVEDALLENDDEVRIIRIAHGG